MGRTATPELDGEVLERLREYALAYRPLFPRSDQFRQGRVYLHGLLLDGERKSIEPLSRRVPGGNEQNLQQFINQSPWDPAPVLRAYRARLAAAFADESGLLVLDDTGFAKQGRHSVGVARQYSGTLGKIGNCQVAVSWHYAGQQGDYPLALRLYLPEVWTDNPTRLAAAGVPPDRQGFRTKWQIALDLLDELRAEELPHHLVVADAGYGAVTEFREGLETREERYIVGLLGSESVFAEPPRWVVPARRRRGRTPSRAHLAADAPRPIAVHDLAERLERTTVRWREGTRGWLEAQFAWVQVWPAHRWGNGVPAEAIPDAEAAARWLLVEWRADGTIKYALSNLPPETTLEQAVPLWKERWQVERGYLQLKDELGLDHFEGRSWTGFHHHATMTFLAYGFLALERRRAEAEQMEREPPGEVRRGA
ncbi:MAG: IS701 family transposase [Chloroflexota bacterium]|nr:IS701 family transposase [Chloroflexota bacterium]